MTRRRPGLVLTAGIWMGVDNLVLMRIGSCSHLPWVTKGQAARVLVAVIRAYVKRKRLGLVLLAGLDMGNGLWQSPGGQIEADNLGLP